MTNENGTEVLINVIDSDYREKNKIFAFFILPIIITLFFIQGLRAYAPGIYIGIFHVVFQDPGWIFSLMVLFTVILLILPVFSNALCSHFGEEKIYFTSIIVIAASRLIMAFHLISILETIFAGIIVGFYGIFLSIFIKNLIKNPLNINDKSKIGIISFSILIAFLIDALLRTIGLTSDISLITWSLLPNFWYFIQYLWLIIQIPLSILSVYFSRSTNHLIFKGIDLKEKDKSIADKRNFWIIIAFGLGMFFFLSFNMFLYPNAIVEFATVNFATRISYNVINPIFICSLTFSVLYILFFKEKYILKKELIIIYNAIFLISLILLLFVAGIMPSSCYIISIVMTVSLTFMFIDLHVLLVNIGIKNTKYVKLKSISNIISIGFLFYLLFVFLFDFTTDHAFTIEAFRGLGSILTLICGISLGLISILAIYQINKTTGGK
ncbi:MAG: hypothetical protein EAX96_00315 [Candidatus Lokiarchaeota archaeon]|nr:hypothetical protein [Candidatus Lokiarchaeota archaeon]